MAYVAGAKLAAAVSNAGGLGIIGGMMHSPSELRRVIDETKSLLKSPDLPWGVDLALPRIGDGARKTNQDYTKGQLNELIDLVIESGAHVFVCAIGIPPKEIIDKLHKHNVIVMNMVGHPKHAKKALDFGVDIVCPQGSEGGGHTGSIATSILTPAVVDIARNYHPSLLRGQPAMVIAAGGISSGRGLAAALVNGAVGVWVGTRFIASIEGNTSDEHKQAVLSCAYDDTQPTLVITGRPLRLKVNEYVADWHKRPAEIQALCQKGIVPFEQDLANGRDLDFPHVMGQVAGSIHKVEPAGKIVQDMVSEAKQMLQLGNSYLSNTGRL